VIPAAAPAGSPLAVCSGPVVALFAGIGPAMTIRFFAPAGRPGQAWMGAVFSPFAVGKIV
jgi:hypothetical protein